MALDASGKLFLASDMAVGELLDVQAGTIAVFSAKSPGRESDNEDAALIMAVGDEHFVLAVADGAGGQREGGEAAKAAVSVLRKSIQAALEEEREIRDAIVEAFERANEDISGRGTGAAATLVVAEIVGSAVRSYNVGDSMLLVVGQKGAMKLRTTPHSPVGYAVEAGLLDDEEAMHHEDRHVVSNLLGSDHVKVEMGSGLDLAPRDTLILGSDGLFDNLHIDEIVELVRKGPLEDVVAELAAACRQRMQEAKEGEPSKPDDLTFIAFRPNGA